MTANEEARLTDSQFRVLALAQSGVKPADIADRVEMTEQEIRDELASILELKHPGADPLVAMELERLETLNRAVWVKAVGGDTSAISRALDISQRKMNILDRQSAQSSPDDLQTQMDVLLRHTLSRTDLNDDNPSTED